MMPAYTRRQLVCPSRCARQEFEMLGGLVRVDRTGACLGHSEAQTTFRCLECGAVAVDLVAAAQARLRDRGRPSAPWMECPACGARLLAPEQEELGTELLCPECQAQFAWDEGMPHLLGQSSDDEES